ncbi:MAG: hypothetical protein HY902_05505 [Deltaproteobacteria bacterium]|nr:hypothetical protein [Deltaproteobacteria bacterium]
MRVRSLRPCFPVLLAAVVAASGCAASGGTGGGWVPATSAGTACSASGATDLCGVSGSQSAQLHCEGGLWVTSKLCDPGMVCTALPGGVLTCVAASGGATGDTQGSDGAPSDASAAEKDAAVADNASPGDTSNPGDAAVTPDTAEPKDVAADISKDTGNDTSKDTAVDTGPATCKPACPDGTFCDLTTSPPSCVEGACQMPTTWGPTTQKVASLAMPGAGVGCDLNGDGKVDNAFGAGLAMLAGQMNDGLTQSIANGSLVLLMDTATFKSNGQTFKLDMLTGALANPGGCDPVSAKANCSYLVSPISYDTAAAAATCPAVVAFSNAKVASANLTAGGPTSSIQLVLPLAGLMLNLTLHKAQLQGKVVGGSVWQQTNSGLLCGVITKSDVEAAIMAVPDEQFASLGMDKATVLQLLGSMLQADFAVNGSAKDAYSIALQWTSVPGEIVGMAPN